MDKVIVTDRNKETLRIRTLIRDVQLLIHDNKKYMDEYTKIKTFKNC